MIGAGLINVRYAPDSDQIPHRSEMTRCARRRHPAKKRPPMAANHKRLRQGASLFMIAPSTLFSLSLPPQRREMIKKILDAFSVTSIAAFLGVIVWVIGGGEEPHVPGHWSTQSLIVLWDIVPCAFGLIWLIFRYAKIAQQKFPALFGRPGQHGLLFYFAFALLAYVFVGRFVDFLWH